MPCIMPSVAFFLNMKYAPAREMIDKGLAIAIASDYNPGSTPSGNMPFVLSLACLKLKMTPEEAINAATLNGAYALELSTELGSITKGKKANILKSKTTRHWHRLILSRFANGGASGRMQTSALLPAPIQTFSCWISTTTATAAQRLQGCKPRIVGCPTQ